MVKHVTSKEERRNPAFYRPKHKQKKNEVEKIRMHTLNDAFVALGKAVPKLEKGKTKMTKHRTLTNAKMYIEDMHLFLQTVIRGDAALKRALFRFMTVTSGYCPNDLSERFNVCEKRKRRVSSSSRRKKANLSAANQHNFDNNEKKVCKEDTEKSYNSCGANVSFYYDDEESTETNERNIYPGINETANHCETAECDTRADEDLLEQFEEVERNIYPEINEHCETAECDTRADEYLLEPFEEVEHIIYPEINEHCETAECDTRADEDLLEPFEEVFGGMWRSTTLSEEGLDVFCSDMSSCDYDDTDEETSLQAEHLLDIVDGRLDNGVFVTKMS